MTAMTVQTVTGVQSLIEKAGSVVRLASIAGVSRTSVLGWRSAGFLPASRVVQISAGLKLPVEQVLKLVKPPKARSNSSKAHAKAFSAPAARPVAANSKDRNRATRTPDAAAESPSREQAA